MTINHVSLLNISGRTHVIPEKTEEQGSWDRGEREKLHTSFAGLDIWVARKAFHSHATAAAAAAQAMRAGEEEAADWSDETIVQ